MSLLKATLNVNSSAEKSANVSIEDHAITICSQTQFVCCEEIISFHGIDLESCAIEFSSVQNCKRAVAALRSAKFSVQVLDAHFFLNDTNRMRMAIKDILDSKSSPIRALVSEVKQYLTTTYSSSDRGDTFSNTKLVENPVSNEISRKYLV